MADQPRRASTIRGSPSSSRSCSTRSARRRDKYRELVVGRPGLWRAAQVRAGDAAGQLGARRARPVPAVEALSAGARLGRPQRRVRRQRDAAPSAQDPHRRQRRHRRSVLPRREGHRQPAASTIGSGVFVGRNTILSCKNGDIVIEDHANIGFNCEIFSASRVRVGKRHPDGRLHLSGRRRPLYDRVDIPVLEQGRTARGIDVGDGVWLGTHVVVTDGSTHRPRRDHRRRRRRGRRDSRVRHRRRAFRRRSCGTGAATHGESTAASAAGVVACHVRHRRHRRSDLEPSRRADAELQRMVRTLRPSRAGRGGQRRAARRRPRHAPAGHRRSGRRPAADHQRDRRHPDRRQRRDLQLPRAAAASSKAAATRSGRATRTSRCSSTPTRSGARTSSPRLRGMFALAIWDGRTRTLIAARDRAGEKPLYWTRHAAGPAPRVRGEGAAGAARGVARARSRGARSVPHLRVRPRAADDPQGRAQAAARALPALPRRRRSTVHALLGCRRRAAARRGRTTSGRGAARRAAPRR